MTVVKGWDSGAKYNCLIFRLSNGASPTLQKVSSALRSRSWMVLIFLGYSHDCAISRWMGTVRIEEREMVKTVARDKGRTSFPGKE